MTLLALGVEGDHEKVVKLLLDTNAVDPNSMDIKGLTPLCRAVTKLRFEKGANYRSETPGLLLGYARIDPNLKDPRGYGGIHHYLVRHGLDLTQLWSCF